MSDSNNENERYSAFEHGFIVPIAGLLALIFAMVTGGAVFNALNGSLESAGLAVTFGSMSVLFFYIRKRRIEAMSEE